MQKSWHTTNLKYYITNIRVNKYLLKATCQFNNESNGSQLQTNFAQIFHNHTRQNVRFNI